MRKKVIIGNWKMNNDKQETENLLLNLKNKTWDKEIEVKVSPSFVSLEYAQKILKNSPVEVVAQNMHYEEKGAFTGEISYKMLKSINVNSVIIGHSERRTLFYENDDTIKRKIKTALDNEMKVIFCFGESLEDRKEKRHIKIISKQLDVITNDLKINQWNQIILAYEPVWAIGTGLVPSMSELSNIFSFIRNTLNKADSCYSSIKILYGGSVTPDNSSELMKTNHMDGLLVGGASLISKKFIDICSTI